MPVSVSLSTQGQFELIVHSFNFPRDLSTPMFHGNEVGIVARFPSNIRCDKIGQFQPGFSISLYTTRIVWQFQDFLIHREV